MKQASLFEFAPSEQATQPEADTAETPLPMVTKPMATGSIIFESDLDQLAKRINAKDRAVRAGAAQTLSDALEVGELLSIAKARVPHGHWLPFLDSHCPEIPARRVQKYMQLSHNREKLKYAVDGAFDLITIESALEAIARPRESEPRPCQFTAPAQLSVAEVTRRRPVPFGRQVAASPELDRPEHDVEEIDEGAQIGVPLTVADREEKESAKHQAVATVDRIGRSEAREPQARLPRPCQGRAISGVDLCTVRVRAMVLEFMGEVPSSDWPEMHARLVEELADIKEIMEKRASDGRAAESSKPDVTPDYDARNESASSIFR